MAGVIETSYTIIIANLAHGLAALLWIVSLRRFVRPLPPAFYASMLQLALVLPVVFGTYRALRGSPHFVAIRAPEWGVALRHAGVIPNAVFFCS